jgi:glycosyltransferase involved in cell wall biosynthesis
MSAPKGQSGAKTKLFIDAMSLGVPRISGIGHNLHGLLATMTKDPGFLARYDIQLIVTKSGLPYLQAWGLSHVRYRTLWMPTKVYNRLPSLPWLPALDLLLGRGVYIFPNYSAWRLGRSKSLTFIHDVSYILFPQFTTPRHRRFMTNNLPRWIKRSRLIATLSEDSKQGLIDHLKIDPASIKIINPGVDTALFYRREQSEVKQLLDKHQLPHDYILFVGNIEPRKNLTRLVEAYAGLPRQLRDTHPLVIAGGRGWREDEINKTIAAARAEGAQIYLPETYIEDSELPALYSGAVLLAYPTLYEGFGIPPLQAMACGVPVLTGANSSLPEVTGDAALLVDAESTTGITQGLVKLLTSQADRTKLVAGGSKRVNLFSWERSLAQLEVALNEVQ